MVKKLKVNVPPAADDVNTSVPPSSQDVLLLEILERVKSLQNNIDYLGESSVKIEAGIFDCKKQIGETIRDTAGMTKAQIRELQTWLDQTLKKPVKPSLWSKAKSWYTDKVGQIIAWHEARKMRKLMRRAAELQELLNRQAEAK